MHKEFLEDGVTPNPLYVKPTETEEERIERLVAERADAKLADIKKKLDASYAARDAALADAAALKLKEQEAVKAKLLEEGKHQELHALQIQEAKDKMALLEAEKKALENRNTELTRDVDLRSALKALTFRNANAAEMAYKEIVGQLVLTDKGTWVHSSGASIADFVTVFSKDENQSFLFKPKNNSGSGQDHNNEKPATNAGKGLAGLSQAEVLKMAAEGKLPQRKR